MTTMELVEQAAVTSPPTAISELSRNGYTFRKEERRSITTGAHVTTYWLVSEPVMA